jgi:hypothetical protein
MFVYAGIDEAGYGPMFGPLVIVRSVFVLDQHEPTLEPPSLWSLLKSTVCKKSGDKKRRLAINDSKILYKPARSLKNIEQGVLSFLSTSGIEPKNLSQLLEQLAFDQLSCQIQHDWYQSPTQEPSVPSLLSLSKLEKSKRRLLKALLHNSIHLADINAAVVFEDRFNRMVKLKGSKASCAWNFVSGHLESIWSQYGEHQPLVVVDRQGGRKNYRELLMSIFSPAKVSILCENPQKSFYRISGGRRQMHILFLVKSENHHFPVALASMVAKYLRELLMARFQSFWSAHAPKVRPTCGYFRDGRRFLKEIQPLIDQLNIDPENLIRCR